MLILPIAGLLFYAKKRENPAGLRFSSGEFFSNSKPTFKVILSRKMIFLRAAILLFLALAMARPQRPLADSIIRAEGIDIVLAIDSSSSMLAEDFNLGVKRVNRLKAVKEVVKEFIESRSGDRIGLVAFAGRAYTVCPLTLDYSWLLKNLERVKVGFIEDGTAIGSGISSSLNRLKDTDAKSKIIILLTDGMNNAGKISPAVAAQAAKALDVKIYTIGAGTKGKAPYPVKDVFGRVSYQPVMVEIDEKGLKEIAGRTEGKYYRATDTNSLREIYGEINRLEKVSRQDKGYSDYQELFPFFLAIAIFLFLTEIILNNTILRRLP